MYKGPSINDVNHLGGGDLPKDVTLHKPIFVNKDEGRVKNLKKWVMSFMDGP